MDYFNDCMNDPTLYDQCVLQSVLYAKWATAAQSSNNETTRK